MSRSKGLKIRLTYLICTPIPDSHNRKSGPQSKPWIVRVIYWTEHVCPVRSQFEAPAQVRSSGWHSSRHVRQHHVRHVCHIDCHCGGYNSSCIRTTLGTSELFPKTIVSSNFHKALKPYLEKTSVLMPAGTPSP